MDVDQQQLQAAMSAPTDVTQPAAIWPAAQARPVLPVYSVEDRLRKRGVRLALGRLAMAGLDVVMLNVAVIVAYYVRYVALRGVAITTVFVPEPFAKFQSLEILVTVGMLASFTIRGLYRLRSTGTWFKQFWTIAGTTTMAFAIFSAYNYVFHGTDLFVDQNRSLVAFTWITVIVGVSLARLVIALILSGLYKRGVGLTNLIVVGSSRLGKLMMQQIAASTYLGYRVVGFIQDSDEPPSDFGRFKVLGTMRDLDTVIRGNRISDVVIALPSHQHQQIMRAVRVCERAGADFKLVPDLYELSLSRIDVDAIEGIPLIGLRRSLTNTWQYRVKRLIDVLGALAALILTAPLWALISLAIKLDSPGPVLLKQTRLGYRGQPFGCYKFRSMHTNADQMLQSLREQNGGDERGKFKLKHDPRRTRVGRFIRRTSIDELPQILNVLRGEMSLVGPRPPVPDEYERYEDWEKARLEMPPGITGLWQVRGRSDIDFDEMVLMDLYYIENWRLRLDIQILFQTIPAVLSRRGAY
ncbi:MAG TPA: sugar transferase [Ktedonobacterales bacterium]|nr:sugar transferase [Ktedonobacterales bacterium]